MAGRSKGRSATITGVEAVGVHELDSTMMAFIFAFIYGTARDAIKSPRFS